MNPNIFSALDGMPGGAVFTATALAALIGTLVMALYAKKPFALAPGMGLNAFFVFTVCLGMGYSWQFALTAVLLEGIIFIILTVTKVRSWLLNAIPGTLKKAIGAGIGLFIAFIGLQNAGIIVNNDSTLGKSPVTCTLMALGAWKRKVTVPSGLMTGDSVEGPPKMACWPKALTPSSREMAISMVLFIAVVFYNANLHKKS